MKDSAGKMLSDGVKTFWKLRVNCTPPVTLSWKIRYTIFTRKSLSKVLADKKSCQTEKRQHSDNSWTDEHKRLPVDIQKKNKQIWTIRRWIYLKGERSSSMKALTHTGKVSRPYGRDSKGIKKYTNRIIRVKVEEKVL